jgi:3-methyladenine DNA glycosylase AlkD
MNALPNPGTAALRSVRREYSKRLKNAMPSKVIELALRLMDGYRFVAYELVCWHPTALASLGPADLKKLGRSLNSWGAVDCFACYLAGPAWRERQVPDALVHQWARSKNRWWRRAAVVSTVPLNNKTRGGRGDPPRTLALCELVVTDKDDMVEKALSWALRELSKRDPASVHAFLDTHRNVLAKRVLREVGNKLATGLKNPTRKQPEHRDDSRRSKFNTAPTAREL